MRRKLSEAVVVVTGPTSGIGRATALRFAEAGATVVLGARRESELQDVVRECEQRGSRALAVRTDVSREEDVQQLARQALEHFGRIDVWVNNAAVTLFARLEEAPTEAMRQVIETNLFGYLYGARAALPIFREQGSGVLINVDSVVASAPQPYTSAYVISKAGIRAMSDCLRMELHLDRARDIHVCTVLPASIDTPFFQHAANYTGRAVKALPPVYPADQVAKAIVQLARHPRREAFVGSAGRMIAAEHAMSPGWYERSAARIVDRRHLEDRPAASTQGNLFQPSHDGLGVSGGWSESGRTLSSRQLALIGLGVALLPVAVWAVARRNGWNGTLRSLGTDAFGRDGRLRALAADTFGRGGRLRELAADTFGRDGRLSALAADRFPRDGALRATAARALAKTEPARTAATRAIGRDGPVQSFAARTFGRGGSLRSLAHRIEDGWKSR
jgi:NAD(P)-dependent dehydrogenase (short-subunit alcohol dehydrogenase family)